MPKRGSRRLSKRELRRRRRRKVMLARVILGVVILGFIGAVGYFGVKLCGSFRNNSKKSAHSMPTSISISSKGVVTGAFEEPFDENVYSTEELERTINEEIEVYNGLAGEAEAIKLDSFEVKDNVAYVKLEYSTCDDYRGFNGIKLYAGRVSDLVPITVIVDKQLFAVKDGAEDISPDNLKTISSRKILCLEEEADVTVPGNILYFSSGVEPTGKRTARVHDIEGKAFVIYK